MALSKPPLQAVGRLRFNLFLRVPLVAMLLPLFLAAEHPAVPARFWLLLLALACLECARIGLLATGFRVDYYATYALLNTAPLVVLLLAPGVLGERVGPPVIAGAGLVVLGGFAFHRVGRLLPAGVLAALAQGLVTVLGKLVLDLSNPAHLMFLVYGASTGLLALAEIARRDFRGTWQAWNGSLRTILPLSGLNLVAIVTYTHALAAAPATHVAVLARTSLIFGFVLSVWLLGERQGWRWKLLGAALIGAGATLITIA